MIDCDFIPSDFHDARTIRNAIRRRAAAVGALLAIMAIWLVAHFHQARSAQAMLNDVASQEQQLALTADIKAEMESERARLARHQALLAQLEGHVSLVLVLSELSRRLPITIVLTSVEINHPMFAAFARLDPSVPQSPHPDNSSAAHRNGSARDSATPNVAWLRITGVSARKPDIVTFAAALESSPLFDRIHLQVDKPVAWAGRRGESFEMACHLRKQLESHR